MKKFYVPLIVILLALCAYFFQKNASFILDWTKTLGIFSPIFFLLLYCVATVLFVPTVFLTLAGGALFGPVLGTLLNLLGACVGAACAFCISRYFVFDWLAMKNYTSINQLIAGAERQGWRFVALIRLFPIIPFNLVNYGLGLTRIPFSHYLIATSIFLIPTEILVTYCGYAGMDFVIHPQSFNSRMNLILLLCFMALLLIHRLVKRYRRNYTYSDR